MLMLLHYLDRNMEVQVIAAQISQPNFKKHIRQFLYEQLNPLFDHDSINVSTALPSFNENINVFPSAVATFYAPSDLCGVGGMRKERIRAVPSWYKGPARYDTVFVETDANAEGMQALSIARARLFFSFTFRGSFYPCALVQWFRCIYDIPDDATGMWVVEPEYDEDGEPLMAVIHLDTIIRASHLIPTYRRAEVPRGLLPAYSLDIFKRFYVNKFVDHHAFEIAF